MGDTSVSLHTLIPTMFSGDVLWSNSNPESQVLTKFSWGEGGLWTNSNLKSQVLTKFSFLGRGGFSGHHIPQILEWGTQGILSTQFSQPKQSPFASHTKCVQTNENQT